MIATSFQNLPQFGPLLGQLLVPSSMLFSPGFLSTNHIASSYTTQQFHDAAITCVERADLAL